MLGVWYLVFMVLVWVLFEELMLVLFDVVFLLVLVIGIFKLWVC